MFSWFKKFGNTKTEESKAVDYKTKYFKKKKKYEELVKQAAVFAMETEELYKEQVSVKFLLFAIVFQCQGRLELTKDTIMLATEKQKEYDIDFREENGKFVYSLKRKEPTS